MNSSSEGIQTNTSSADCQVDDGGLVTQTQTSTPAPVEIASLPERRWAIDCTDPKLRNRMRERFKSLAAHAAEVEVQTKYEHRFQAVDAWLDLLKRETRFAQEWKISLLLTASAEYCGELKLRALTSERRWDVEIWSEIERQLRTIIAENPRDELYAIDRGVNSSIVGPPHPKHASRAASGPSDRTDCQLKVR